MTTALPPLYPMDAPRGNPQAAEEVATTSAEITIAGLDVTQYIDLATVKVGESPTQSLFSMDFQMQIPSQAVPTPLGGNEIIWRNGTNREFGGEILTADETMITPDTFLYDVKCVDYTHIFDRHQVVEDYAQQAASATVQNAVTAFVNQGLPTANLAAFTVNNVQAAPVVAARKIDYQDPSKVVKQLADELSWSWYIDYFQDVHFFPIESFVSPLSGNALDADTDLVNYGDLTLEDDASQVKNRIFVKGFKTMSTVTVTDHFTGDGQTTTFHLQQEPASLKWQPSGYPSVFVGGTQYIPKNDMSGGMPGTSPAANQNAYFYASHQTVRFDVAPADLAQIVVTYYYVYQPVTMVEDPQAQWAMAARDGSDGIYEYAVTDSKMSGSDTSLAEARGQLLLLKYAYPALTGTLTSYTQGWRAGQYFYLTSAARMGGIASKRMWVLKVTKTIVNAIGGAQTLKYDLEISDRPYAF